MTVGIVSAIILIVTFGVKEVLKERAKDAADALEAAESLHRAETGQSTLSLQIQQVHQHINLIKQTATAPSGQKDLSALIQTDTNRALQVRAGLNVSVDSVSRLIESLPKGLRADLLEQLNQQKARIEKSNAQIAEMLKPSVQIDLQRVVSVKIAIAMSLAEEIPIAVIGDAALTRVRRAKEISDHVYRYCRLASYALYTASVLLGLYALITHGKTLGVE